MKRHLLCLLAAVVAAVTAGVPAGASSAPSGGCTMQTERPAYDANINQIRFFVANQTTESMGYGTPYSLEFAAGDFWKPVPTIDNGKKAFPAIGIVLMPGQTNTETIQLDSWYKQPMNKGQYRIRKTIGDKELTAEFQILPASACLKLNEPLEISAALDLSTQKGAFTVGPKESPSYATELWHELLAFQKGTPDKIPAGNPDAVLTMTDKKRTQTVLPLYQTQDKTWTKKDSAWYYAMDTGVVGRIDRKGRELGAYLPGTGPELIGALNRLQPLRDVKLKPHRFSSPFAYDGWQSDRETSGVTLSVFQFPSAEELNMQMHYLYEDGYTIRMETRSKDAVSFAPKRFEWSEPPHYFKAGSRLVLYNGSDQRILTALKGLLGPQVQTVEEKTAEQEMWGGMP